MLRSIKKSYELIKAEDKDTSVTVHTIKTWCREGKIKYITVGNRILIDFDSLKNFISCK